MTCREKLKQEYPNEYDRVFTKEGVTACPLHYKYHFKPTFCDCDVYKTIGGTKCHKCWDREIEEIEYNDIVNTLEYKPQKSEPLFKVNEVKEENGGLTVNMTPIIKDSGDRTEFESGAVRDMRAGKGRCDLMPLEVLARMFDRYDGKNGVFDFLVYFKNTNSTHHLVKALDRFALDTYGTTEKAAYATMFLEVAKHFEDGATKYGENNWQKGIPSKCYIDSAIRHYLKWLRGDRDEPHDRAFVWNLMCCIWEVDYHKEKE